MRMTHDIRIKVTPLQYEIIKNKAQVHGFKTVSSFIRSSVFNENDSMLKEIHEIIVKKQKVSKEVGIDLLEDGRIEMEV